MGHHARDVTTEKEDGAQRGHGTIGVDESTVRIGDGCDSGVAAVQESALWALLADGIMSGPAGFSTRPAESRRS